MPPKKAGSSAKTQALTRTGPKEVISHPSEAKKHREYVEKPTTTRALVLRNGKHGAMGAGELFMSNRITGKEKLDLLAEELIEKMKQAVLTPFRLDQSLRIAESKFHEFLDDIADLRDPQLFRYVIEDEIIARTPVGTEPRRNATAVAVIVGTRVHNTYMVASAWRIITDNLKRLSREGVTDSNIKSKLKTDDALRQRYLVLYDMVGKLVDIFHKRVSVLATTSPYYSKYFKARPADYTGTGDPELGFDLDDKKVRAITSSFLDCIIVELLLPGSKIPSNVLYQLLQDVLQESPNQAKRFTQSLWNAIGDLSFAVQLQTILEAAIVGPDEKTWKEEPRSMPEEFEKWVDAYLVSLKATENNKNWKDTIFPLVSTRKKDVLDNMWKTINLNYKSYTGEDIDSVWQLTGAFNVTPQWSSYYIPHLAEDSDAEDDAPDGMPLLTNRPKGKRKPLALTATGEPYDSGDSMPALQSISNSSEEDLDSDEESDDDEEDYESESDGYDEDQEDTLRDMLREAMDAAHDVDWFESTKDAQPSDLDPFKAAEERKGNPFMNLLGSLRGRFLSSNSKLKAETQRTEPRRGAFRATRSGAPKEVPKGAPPKPTKEGEKDSQKTTMEEVEDEDADVGAGTGPSKKKKKKKSNKKKKATGAGEGEPASPELAHATPQPTPAKPKAPATPASPSAAAATPNFNIPVGATQAASGHSYLKQLNTDFQQKAKIKTRADHASLFSTNTNEEGGSAGGLFSKVKSAFGGKTEGSQDSKNAKYTWFSRLSKKATDSMHQLLRTGEDAGKQPSPMKWETFLKLMREMGFEYDPSTAGSSVRFDPPNPKDSSITIHKPHPDSTLAPIQLIKIGKRLKRYYGWNEEDFIKATNTASAAN
ncbi:hypothetical protein DFP72DRAFT_1030216 [Ephemerocybe angulata]|uniref:Uncharacterized protein n=1 Tax=Ephemerocybe angulata TaxID=980116 RepID=A0A8H6IET4_9AGAR|nr:hypothetical protein DFP72DRAFT_1030216 [Tulosesus angulatus]